MNLKRGVMLRCNAQYLDAFWRALRLEGRKLATVRGHETGLRRFVERFGSRNFLTVSRGDLEDFVLESERNEHLIRSLKKLYRILDRPEMTARIRMPRPKRRLLPSELLDEGDITKMLMGSRSGRDMAIIGLLWDAGLRPIELLTMKLSSIDFTHRPAHITVGGKNGDRTIPISDWVARLLLNYVDSTPRIGDGWLWLGGRKNYGRMSNEALLKMLRMNARKVGIEKPIYVYAFRHSSASRDAGNGYTEMQMDLKYGWVFRSEMPSTYIHLNPDVLDGLVTKIPGSCAYLERDIPAFTGSL